MRRLALAGSAVLALAASACSSSDDREAGSGEQAGSSTSEWTKLIEGSWTLEPGGEKGRDCHKVKIEEDTWITAIRPIHPPGTHHTLLTLGDENSECTTAVASGLLYAAGIGSEGLELPPGVGIKLPAGKWLNLGLHIYNPTEDPLEGTSGIEVKVSDAADIEFESEAVLAGPFNISLAPKTETTVTGTCDITTEQHLYALFPHMHQLGTHFKTVVTAGGEDQVLHDAAYDFEEQLQIPLDPILEVGAGDKITTSCTYQNDLDKTVTFGESSDAEMCFSILFRYPAQGSGFCNTPTSTTVQGTPCAKEGDVGNDQQVGQLCTRGGAECQGNPGATLCLADIVAGDFGNFCTKLCTDASECGEGAGCYGPGDSKVCVPEACIGNVRPAN